MRGSTRTDWLLLISLLLMTAVGALIVRELAPPQRSGGFRSEPSSFYNASYGSKASFLTLERLGYPVARLRRPLATRTLQHTDLLFLLAPTQGLTRSERDDLLAWVDGGGTLLIVPPHQGLAGDSYDPDDDWFRWAVGPTTQPGREHHSDTIAKTCLQGPATPLHPLAIGAASLCIKTDRRLDAEKPLRGPIAKDDCDVVWSDERGVILAEVAHGRGRMIVACDAYPFTNTGISDADHLPLLLNILSRADHPGGDRPRLAFDEFHLGFPERSGRFASVLRLVLAGPWGLAAAQLLVILTLALYARGVRFGPARNIVYKRRRSHAEFIIGAARLLAAARAWGVVWQTLYPYYRGRLCRLLHLPPTCGNDELARAVHQRIGQNVTPALTAGANAGPAATMNKASLQRHCDELERAIERLEHGTQSRL